MSKVITVTGGSRSGKSVLAEKKAVEYGGRSVLYLATAIPTDEDMKETALSYLDSYLLEIAENFVNKFTPKE